MSGFGFQEARFLERIEIQQFFHRNCFYKEEFELLVGRGFPITLCCDLYLKC